MLSSLGTSLIDFPLHLDITSPPYPLDLYENITTPQGVFPKQGKANSKHSHVVVSLFASHLFSSQH
jgi:hypothetical protein